MTQNRTIAKVAMLMLAMCLSTNVMAQKSKPTDKDIIGVWVMESMQFEGQPKIVCGADGYNQVKVYRANGEYACAEVVATTDGGSMIIAHEYGTYSYKDGKYIECGRKSVMNMTDKTHFEGPWRNRYDKWRKATDMPASLVDYIVDKCKRRTDPKDIQALTKKHILAVPKGK